LLCDGSGILRANYADLDSVVYCGDPDNPTADAFYHADDAGGSVRNTAGVYLILPDWRGRALRGLDPTAIRDPDGASRTLGDYQDDRLMKHNHVIGDVPSAKYQYVGVWGNTGGSPNVTVIGQAGTKAGATERASSSQCGVDIDVGFTNIPGVGLVNQYETRMNNGSVNWFIWY